MAGQADGSIIVDTEIDAQGFKAGSAELQRAIKSLNTKVSALGPTFQKAMSGNESAISAFDAKASALEDTISEIEAEMESLGNKRIPTESYEEITDKVEKAEQALFKLYDKQDKMEATGVKENSRAWRSLQYDIRIAEEQLERFEREKANMEASGTAFQMGSDTAQYAQLESSLSAAKDKLAQMRSEVENTGKSSNRLVSIAKGIGKVFSTVGKVGISAFKALKTGIQTGITKLKSLGKTASGGCTQAISKLGKKITGLGSMMKRMLTRKLIMAMFEGVKEGVNNLAQYSSQTNASLSTLKSGLTQLKNSLATAFAPILTAITPALATLINYLSAALTYIGKFVAALTGAKTFTKATAVQEDYADSLGNTGSAAEKAQKQLAGFDELNVLSDSKSNSGGGSGGASPSEMFEEVPIESSITDFVDRLKDAFRNGDYAEIGRIIGEGINTALGKVNKFISWDNVGGTVTKVVSGIAEGFNSLIYTVDWELLGDTIAQGLNTALNTLYLVITKFDWPAVAAALARSLNGLVSGFDWGLLGTNLSTWFTTALKSLRSAITTFKWADLGKGVAEAINKIDWVGAFKQAAGALSDAVKALLDLCIGFVEKLDWGKLGKDLWNSLVAIVTEIDWGGIVSKAFRLLGGAIGGAAKLLVEFGKAFWESLKSALKSTFNYFGNYVDETGHLTIQGFFQGIWDAIKGVGNWIVEHIWNPFIEGFKNAFGIHSPSTKMAEMGKYVIEGLWNGIKAAWTGIVDFFKNALSKLGDLIKGAWDGIKNAASTAWNGIKGVISGAWNGIKSGVSSAYNAVKSGISGAWNSIKSTASSAWNGIKSTLSTAWNNIKSNTTSAYNTLKSNISGAWDSVKSTASSKWSSIKTTISNSWGSLKSSATTWGKDLCQNMANGISSAANAVGNAVSGVANKIKSFLGFSEPEKGPLSNFHTFMPDMIDLMTYGIEKNQGTAIGAVSDMASAIAQEIQGGDYTFGGIEMSKDVGNSLGNFADQITDSFTNLLDRLQAIAQGVTFAVPATANGAIPYTVSASANGSQNGVTDAITASNDELSSVIIQSVTNATAAIVGAIQDYSGTTVNLDSNSLTTSVIKEINRRTRMNGTSPLLI